MAHPRKRNKDGYTLTRLNFRFCKPDRDIREQCFVNDCCPCPQGHMLRDEDNYWCEKCVRKITSGICGFDINFLSSAYRTRSVVNLLKNLPIHLGPDECWPIAGALEPDKRIIVPRPGGGKGAFGSIKRKTAYRKLLYTLFWGDVGNVRVTMNTPPHGPCTDPECCNPLHMVSAFNVSPTPPRDFSYLNLEIDPEKFAMYCQAESMGKNLDDLYLTLAKVGIRDPRMDQEEITDRTYCTYDESESFAER
jgi:hypothetical protein